MIKPTPEEEANDMMQMIHWVSKKTHTLGSTYSSIDVSFLTHLYKMHKYRDNLLFLELESDLKDYFEVWREMNL